MSSKEIKTGATLLEDLANQGSSAASPTPLGDAIADAVVREDSPAPPPAAQPMPSQLVCESVPYVLFPDGVYRSAGGQTLDITQPPGSEAYVQGVMAMQAPPAPAGTVREPENQDVHTVDVEEMVEAIAAGARFCIADCLVPGEGGNQGIKPGHSVVMTIRGEKVAFTVSHVMPNPELMDGPPLVSIEPGRPADVDTIAVPIRGVIREWLFNRVAAHEDPGAFVARLVGNAWMNDPTRTASERTMQRGAEGGAAADHRNVTGG